MLLRMSSALLLLLLLLLPLLLLDVQSSSASFSSGRFEDLLLEQDRSRLRELSSPAEAKRVSRNFKAARDRFYRITSAPLATTCRVMKLMGRSVAAAVVLVGGARPDTHVAFFFFSRRPLDGVHGHGRAEGGLHGPPDGGHQAGAVRHIGRLGCPTNI